jgi:hypothetical protein
MEQSTQKPEGKGMGVAGFVISLVALVFYFIVGLEFQEKSGRKLFSTMPHVLG